jgi:hypothetical protein
MYLEGGPQFGLMHKAWVEFNSDIDNVTTKIKDFNKDRINSLDAGVSIGSGYKLMADTGMTIGFRYYYGLTNVYKGVSGTNNNSFILKVNIPIGASKTDDLIEEE